MFILASYIYILGYLLKRPPSKASLLVLLFLFLRVLPLLSSYIVEFDVPAYPGLYPSFLVFVPKPRPKGLGAFHKQLAATTLTGDHTSSFGYLIMGYWPKCQSAP